MTGGTGTSSEASADRHRRLAGLEQFTIAMGFLHLAQGVFMILVSNDTTYPIFSNFLSFNPETFSLAPV